MDLFFFRCRYPYVSHLVCNAGCAFWSGVDKLLAVRMILTKGLSWAITLPPYKLQKTGIMSKDGLGMTWQCNLFGHYVMVCSASSSLSGIITTVASSIVASSHRSRRTRSASHVLLGPSGRALWRACRTGTTRKTGSSSRRTTLMRQASTR